MPCIQYMTYASVGKTGYAMESIFWGRTRTYGSMEMSNRVKEMSPRRMG